MLTQVTGSRLRERMQTLHTLQLGRTLLKPGWQDQVRAFVLIRRVVPVMCVRDVVCGWCILMCRAERGVCVCDVVCGV